MERMYFLIRLGFECYSLIPWTGKQQNFPQDSVAGIGCGEGGGALKTFLCHRVLPFYLKILGSFANVNGVAGLASTIINNID